MLLHEMSLAELNQMKHDRGSVEVGRRGLSSDKQHTLFVRAEFASSVLWSVSCTTVVLFLLAFFQVAVCLRIVGAVTMGRGAPGTTSL